MTAPKDMKPRKQGRPCYCKCNHIFGAHRAKGKECKGVTFALYDQLMVPCTCQRFEQMTGIPV